MTLSWRRSYLESITVQAPQPPSPQPSFVPLSPTGWSRVKEYELREKKVFVGLLGNAWTELRVKSHSSTHRLRPLNPGGSRPTRSPTQTGSGNGANSIVQKRKGTSTHVSTPGTGVPLSLILEIFLGSRSSSMWASPHITPAGRARKPFKPAWDLLSSASLIPPPNLLD